MLKELEQKSIEADESLCDLKSNMETTRINLHLSNGRIKTAMTRVKEVTEKVEQMEEAGGAQPAKQSEPVQQAAPDLTPELQRLQQRI